VCYHAPRKLSRSTIAGKKSHSEDPAPAVIYGFLEGAILGVAQY